MENVLEILNQKVEKGFFKLIGTSEGEVCNCPEMYVDEYRIIGVVEISKDSLKSTLKWGVYKEKVKLEQFSKKIKKESRGLYVIKESGLGYSRDFIKIALLILDRKKTMVDLPSEPCPLRMYDDKFAIYIAPRIDEEDIEEVDEMSDGQKSVLIQLWDLLNDYFDLKNEGKYIEAIKKMEREIYDMIKMIAENSISFFMDGSEIKLEREQKEKS